MKNRRVILVFLLLSTAAEILPLENFSRPVQAQIDYESELEETRYELLTYILNHKMATAALLVSGGGVAAVLQENLEEDTRNFFLLMGLLGVAYCVDNAQECSTVATDIMSYATTIKYLKKAQIE